MPRESAEPLDVKIALMHRRDVRHVMPIERSVYPRGWSKGVFMREIAQRTTRCYLMAKVGSTLVGYTGMLLAPDEAHITNVAVAPEWQRHKLATRLLLTQAGWHRGAAPRVDARGPPEQPRCARALPAVRVRARRGCASCTTAIPDEDGLIMWAHDIDEPAYLSRLRAIETEIPGTTVVDDEVWK